MSFSADRPRGRLAIAARLWLPVALVCLTLFLENGASGQTEPGRLDSRLEQLVVDAAAGKVPSTGEVNGVDVTDGSARVIVEARAGMSERAADGVTGAGAEIEASFGSLLQVEAPITELKALSGAPGVAEVRPPLRAYPVTNSEGVALTHADSWQTAGLTGAGVKVAILDLGFQGYEAKLGTELPASVTAISFVAGGDIHGGGEVHGTAVAEVVHDMAPGAELYLANFATEVELANATAWLAGQGVRVINASWGYFTAGPGDGTGIVDDIIAQSVDAGVFWSVAAGNSAARHWSGQFRDTDGNSFHEFSLSPFDEGNQLGGTFGILLAGNKAIAELRWNDPFGAACRDYDLYLMRTDDQGLAVAVASSQNVQNDGTQCIPGANPVEVIDATVPVTDNYHWVIRKKFASSDATFDLFSILHDLRYQTAAGSLLQPADSPRVTTLGAVPYYSPNTIEPYSSRGPTTDGRIKPDIAAPDGVSNSTYGNFSGTSAAAPHLTGATALLLGIAPCLSPAAAKTTLLANVVDLGAAGTDNVFGAGRLSLGAVPADVDTDGVGNICDNCPEVPNAGQANSEMPPDEYGDDCEQPGCVTIINHWVVPTGDTDCDGYPDSQTGAPLPVRGPESFVGTLVTAKCSATPGTNDEPLPDAWPPDFNDNQLVNGSDFLQMNPFFGSSQAGGPPYDARHDLSANAVINGGDFLQMNPFFGKRCSP